MMSKYAAQRLQAASLPVYPVLDMSPTTTPAEPQSKPARSNSDTGLWHPLRRGLQRGLRCLVGALALGLVTHGAYAAVRAVPSDPDQVFAALRDASRDNDPATAAALAARIPDYPIASYVEYFKLKPQLFDGAGHALTDVPDA